MIHVNPYWIEGVPHTGANHLLEPFEKVDLTKYVRLHLRYTVVQDGVERLKHFTLYFFYSDVAPYRQFRDPTLCPQPGRKEIDETR